MPHAALRTGLPVAVLVGLGAAVALVVDTGEPSSASSLRPAAAAQTFALGRQGSSASADVDETGVAQQAYADAAAKVSADALAAAQEEADAKARAEADAKARAAAATAAREEAARQAAAQAARSAVRASVDTSDPRGIARSMVADRGWGSGQFSCLDALWQKESGWNPQARNSSSGAFGVAQALPPQKMASAGSDWRTNPATQIEWGLDYIAATYGTPCGAWAHSRAVNWY